MNGGRLKKLESAGVYGTYEVHMKRFNKREGIPALRVFGCN